MRRNELPVFAPAHRVNQSLTAPLEKRALEWMAKHAPRWLTSGQLTVLGLGAQLAAGTFYALSRYNHYALLLVNVCLVLNWLGDSMDGTLARVRRQQRPRYGFYVDHMVDIFGAVVLMCGLGHSGFVHWQTAITMLIAFLLLSGESYLATYTLSRFQLSQGIFGPTEIRVLLIIGKLGAPSQSLCDAVRTQDAVVRCGRNNRGSLHVRNGSDRDRTPYRAALPARTPPVIACSR